MTRKRTSLIGAAALLLSFALLAPTPGHAQRINPGELFGAWLRQAVALGEALWQRSGQPLRGAYKAGPMTDPDGSAATTEQGPMTDPDGSAATTEHGPASDPDG
jgi:hypothetical protein